MRCMHGRLTAFMWGTKQRDGPVTVCDYNPTIHSPGHGLSMIDRLSQCSVILSWCLDVCEGGAWLVHVTAPMTSLSGAGRIV